MKVCTTCLLPKPLNEFSPHKRYAYGRDAVCRVCLNTYRRSTRRQLGIKPRPIFLERIWNYVQTCSHEELCIYCCWPWLGGRNKQGYGTFTFRDASGKQRGRIVTGVIYELHNMRAIPHGLNTLHHCDFPPCCNPLHLWLGTYQDNATDAVHKGRTAKGLRNGKYTKPEATPRGEAHGMVKLTSDDVLAIRLLHEQGLSQMALSRQYGITQTSIYRIVHRKSWTHI